MNPKIVRIVTHVVMSMLAIIGGVLAIADKVAALPFIPNEWTKYWGVFVAGAAAVKPILLIIGDLLDDGVINQSFKGSLPVTAMICILLLPGCATDTGNPKTDQRGRVVNAVATEAAKVAWSFLLTSGENYLAGQNGQDAAKSAFGAAIQGYDGAAGLANIVKAAAGPQAAQVASAAYIAANPQTPAQKVAVANSVGAAFQQFANANVSINP